MKIGILGGGQLAQLLSYSAYQLGLEVICYAPSSNCPAARNSSIIVGELDNREQLTKFAEQVDVISLENENIDVATLHFLQARKPLAPNPAAIKTSQDRLLEKALFTKLGFNTAHYQAVNSLTDLDNACESQPLPGLLKTRRFGYDGKGQARINSTDEAQQAWNSIAQQPAILESFVDFDYEVSLIAARNHDGHCRFFPLLKNQHHNGILRLSTLLNKPNLQQKAQNMLNTLLSELQYVGVLTLELFVKGESLYANEMAPRVHNSGHLTIEGCNCSQFEAHLRAITNLPLPKIEPTIPTAMINIIGIPPPNAVLQQTPLHYYDYGKSPRPNRKLGHLTVQTRTEDELSKKVAQIDALTTSKTQWT